MKRKIELELEVELENCDEINMRMIYLMLLRWHNKKNETKQEFIIIGLGWNH